MVESPLNYTGGKYKLFPQIMPLFPKNIDTFVDLFCGGCNVGVNAACQKVIYNDISGDLISLYNALKNHSKESVLDQIYEIINRYGLSLTSLHGYSYYGCDSSEGLAKYNKEKYMRLRADFNKSRRNPIMLYVLIAYAFNNQIRFNKNGEFNLACGKRDFNKRMEQKLLDFISKIQKQDCTFINRDFREIDLSRLTEKDFVYADPPYLITCATYNERRGWGEDDETDLLSFLDDLNSRNIRFALSNVLSAKGKQNQILAEWLRRKKYKVVRLNHSYSNSNYHIKDKQAKADEILVMNF